MDIYWLGHACFRLRSTTSGLSIITDPYAQSLGVRIDPRQIADVVAVTVSHDDKLHNNPADLVGNPRVFSSPGEYEFQGIIIRAVMTPLPPETPREQRNVAYTVTLDGVNVCHLGNISQPLTAPEIDLIGPADVVLAPAGGADRNLLSYRAINQAAQQLDARWLIPMHFKARGETSDVQPEGATDFLRELGVADGALESQGRMQVTRNNLPPTLSIGLLTPQFRAG
jgi:L-ascorbate metabolism protein UlaG (beta-lactamase superfamily)